MPANSTQKAVAITRVQQDFLVKGRLSIMRPHNQALALVEISTPDAMRRAGGGQGSRI